MRRPRSSIKTAVLGALLAACGLDLAGRAGDGGTSLDAGDTGTASLPETAPTDGGPDGDAVPSPCGDTTANPQNCGACGHDCKGATCIASVCTPETLGTNFGTPRGLAITSALAYVADSSSGNIYTVVLPNGGAPILFHATQRAPRALAAGNTDVYWVDQGDIGVKPLLGSANVNSIGGGRSLVLAGSRLYYATGTGSIESRDLGLSNTQAHATDEWSPLGVVVDTTHVYWAAVDAGAIGRAALPNGAKATVVADAGLNTRSVAVDATHVYWTNESEIVKAQIGVWSPTVLVSGEGKPLSLIHDSGFLYWVDAAKAKVRRVAVTGGPALTLANDPQGTFDYGQLLAVDTTHLYWISTVAPGALRRIAK